MKKLLLALILGAFSLSAMANHHGGQKSHKHKSHAKTHHKHQKAPKAAEQKP